MKGIFNITTKKKLKILNYTVFGLIIFLAIFLSMFHGRLNSIRMESKEIIEDQWRDEARNTSLYLAQKLELAISRNEVNYWDDKELHQWASDNILSLKVGSELSNCILVNVGFSTREWNPDLWNEVKLSRNIVIDEEVDDAINEYFIEMSTGEKSNIVVDRKLKSVAEYLKSTYDIDYDTVIIGLREVAFVKEKIIIDDNPLTIKDDSLLNTRFLQDFLMQSISDDEFEKNLNVFRMAYSSKYDDKLYMTTPKGIRWLEWNIVPPNKLGWELEPPHIEGVENYKFKKIAIIISIDSNDIMQPYDDIFEQQLIIEKLCLIGLLILVLLGILVSFYNLYKFLRNDTE